MMHRLRLAVVPLYLTLCLVLGGASGGGHWANLALQLLAIPIILWTFVERRGSQLPTSARPLIILLVLAALLCVIQLIPLPPGLWTSLPGREQFVRGFALVDRPVPWAPLSLAPYRSTSSILWTLPAIAVLLAMLRLGLFSAKWIAWSLITVTAIGVGIGALQLSGGPSSRLYFYSITNFGAATGFFANTNNMAEVMVVAIPFLGAIYLSAVQRGGGSVQKRSSLLALVLGSLAVLAVGIAVNGSLAGIGLAVPTIAAVAMMIFFRRRRLPIWGAAAVVGLLAASVGLVLSAGFENNLTSEAARADATSRFVSFKTTIEAAKDFAPVGSGIGTFPEIYPLYEDPGQVDRWYMNHAHNDYLEIALETGVAGVVLMLLFLAWWGVRVAAIWRAEEPDQFARAATIGSAVILAHSAVEFPLRTAAISALFAVCCALMADARSRARRSEKTAESRPDARHLSAD